jgi:hypothetical protein
MIQIVIYDECFFLNLFALANQTTDYFDTVSNQWEGVAHKIREGKEFLIFYNCLSR